MILLLLSPWLFDGRTSGTSSICIQLTSTLYFLLTKFSGEVNLIVLRDMRHVKAEEISESSEVLNSDNLCMIGWIFPHVSRLVSLTEWSFIILDNRPAALFFSNSRVSVDVHGGDEVDVCACALSSFEWGG